MARFSFDEDTSGSKRKQRNAVEERASKMKRTNVPFERNPSESETEEQESVEGRNEGNEPDSNDVGYEDEIDGEMNATREETAFCEGNKDDEFNFSIDPDLLECSICFEPLCPPIFQCRNGHTACSSCCPKLSNKCHVCSQSIGRLRCLALEKVLESVKCRCRYTKQGCSAVIPFAQKAFHEKETCNYGTFFCPVSDCGFCGSMSCIVDHVELDHAGIVIGFSYDLPFKIALERHQPLMILLGEDSHMFLLLNRNLSLDENNELSVICLSPTTPEPEFSCALWVHSRGSSLQLRTPVDKFRKWDGSHHPRRAFLVVPDGFFPSSNTAMSLHCRIKKSASEGNPL